MGTDDPARRREIESSTAARLAEILASAEEAAKQVFDEAEADARERIAEAEQEADRVVTERLSRLAALTDDLDAQAEQLKRGAEALRQALAQARAELVGVESLRGSAPARRTDPPAAPEANGDRPAGPSLTVVGATQPPPVPQDFDTPAGARLLATQMAVSGSSREEIEARLRSGFAIADTTAILDAILGPEL